MTEAMATGQQEWVNRYYSEVQLKDKRRNLLRSCRYAVFRQLVRSGELTSTLRRTRMSAGGGGGPEGHEVKPCGGEPLPAPLERIEELLRSLLCRHKNQHHSDPAAPEYGQCAAAPVGRVDPAYRNPRPTHQTTKGVPWYEEKEIRYDAIHELEGVQGPRQSEFGILRREESVLDVISSIDAGPFRLVLEPITIGDAQPSTLRLRKSLEAWLESLCPENGFRPGDSGIVLEPVFRWED